ncbi:hypothetical protein [Sphingomonas nostoxanthinifaciens]|uniref:hypothetical protein n=1 Tax=Sphingomonas nostoxanthinifaciens TaxID=2872652 RepID=UPI001CC1DA8D|nr:hypothetical protein [Sphingomonas nostoxanthinifaciens]UAK23775.1 hypothetical protein K8P63_15525 [Sphingomonas nostoxanthinifaciens]
MVAGRGETIGADLAAVTMGIDRFERSRSSGESLLDGEGLVPIFMGDDIVEARSYSAWDEVFADIDELAVQVEDVGVDQRGIFLRDMVPSLRAAAQLFSGAELSYAEKVRDLVGAEPAPVPDEEIAAHATALSDGLARAGFSRGTLRNRVESWEAARAIAPERIEAEFRALMALARARTAAMIFDPGDYDMALNPLRDVPFTARCGFAERRMDLNVDNAFTRAGLKHLVCHEVFPGHATQLLSTRAEVDAGRSEPDALLCTTNAVTGCVQEGIGDQGVQLIDWIEDLDDEIHLALRSLKSAAQTTAAWRLMAEGQPRDEVADYLRTVACGQEAWVQGRLRMASHPFRGPFIASYYAGNESVRRVRERVSPEQRGEFIATLYGEVHSPQSLEMFGAEAAA